MAALEGGADDYVTKPFDRDVLAPGSRWAGGSSACKPVIPWCLPSARGGSEKPVHAWPFRPGHVLCPGAGGKTWTAATDLDLLRRGGLLHDIGKISVPDFGPEQARPPDRRGVRNHQSAIPRTGSALSIRSNRCRISFRSFAGIMNRLDGRGYPDGLCGEQIPLWCASYPWPTCTTLCRARRPYRPAMPHEECLKVMRTMQPAAAWMPTSCSTLPSCPAKRCDALCLSQACSEPLPVPTGSSTCR